MEERRRSPRQRMLKVARIRFGATQTVPCVLRDVSKSGAQLLVATVNGIPSEFRLDLDEGQPQSCFVRWRKPSALGVVFLAPQEASFGP